MNPLRCVTSDTSEITAVLQYLCRQHGHTLTGEVARRLCLPCSTGPPKRKVPWCGRARPGAPQVPQDICYFCISSRDRPKLFSFLAIGFFSTEHTTHSSTCVSVYLLACLVPWAVRALNVSALRNFANFYGWSVGGATGHSQCPAIDEAPRERQLAALRQQ